MVIEAVIEKENSTSVGMARAQEYKKGTDDRADAVVIARQEILFCGTKITKVLDRKDRLSE